MNRNRKTLKRTIVPLPYNYYFIPALVAATLGIANSFLLAVTHYKNYTDLTYKSFCAISRSINCDTVAQSPWSFFAGIPIAYWGILGYVLFLAVLLKARKVRHQYMSLWAFLLLLSIAFVTSSIFLGYISFTKIHSYCILCIFNHFLSFVLFAYCFISYRRFGPNTLLTDLLVSLKILFYKKSNFITIATIFMVFVATWIFMPVYWNYELAGHVNTVELQKGVTPEGNPWIGSQDAKKIIHIYSDYMCFQCLKIHHLLLSMVANDPKNYKLVIHHYPLDHSYNPIVVKNPYHVGSGKMAQLAVYAMTIGKFWEMNDALFKIGRQKKPFNTELISETTGISSGELVWALKQEQYRKLVDVDIRRGMKYRITSTPSFVIDGKVYSGSLPEEIMH